MTVPRSIDTADALYRKVERTFYRRAVYRDDQLDWVFDVAVTAWHLVDWVAKERGTTLRSTQNGLKTKCPALAVCEQVCNGAKHFNRGGRHLQGFNVGTDVYVTEHLAGVSKLAIWPGDNADVVLTPAVWITDKDGKSWDAIDVFTKVVLFWQRELSIAT